MENKEPLPTYSFMLRLNESTKKYKLIVNQTIKTKDNEQHTEIKVTVKITMKQFSDKQAYYDLSFTPPVINGRGLGKYEKWDWIFARIFLINKGLRVIIGQRGDFQGVANKDFILGNWEKTKKDIQTLYEPENTNELLNGMEQALYSDFDACYRSDNLINLLFNDIYRLYEGDEKSTPKIIGKHFGDIPVVVTQRKWLESLDREQQSAVISFESDWNTEKANVNGINQYLAWAAPSGIGKELEYEFSCTGHYVMDISKTSEIKDAEMVITGKMGEHYFRYDRLKLNKMN